MRLSFLRELQKGVLCLNVRLLLLTLHILTATLLNVKNYPLFSESYFRFLELLAVSGFLFSSSFLCVHYFSRTVRVYLKSAIHAELVINGVWSFLLLIGGISGYTVAPPHSVLTGASLSASVTSIIYCYFAAYLHVQLTILFPKIEQSNEPDAPNVIISLGAAEKNNEVA